MTGIRLMRARSHALSLSQIHLPLRVGAMVLALVVCLWGPSTLRAAPILDELQFDSLSPDVTLSYDGAGDPAAGTANPVYGGVTFQAGIVGTSVFGQPFADNSRHISADGNVIRIKFNVPITAFGSQIEADAQSAQMDVRLEIHAFDSGGAELTIGDGVSSTLGIVLGSGGAFGGPSGQPFAFGQSFVGFQVSGTTPIDLLTISDVGTLFTTSFPRIDDTKLVTTAVPEPAGALLLALGLAGLAARRRQPERDPLR